MCHSLKFSCRIPLVMVQDDIRNKMQSKKIVEIQHLKVSDLLTSPGEDQAPVNLIEVVLVHPCMDCYTTCLHLTEVCDSPLLVVVVSLKRGPSLFAHMLRQCQPRARHCCCCLFCLQTSQVLNKVKCQIKRTQQRKTPLLCSQSWDRISILTQQHQKCTGIFLWTSLNDS